MPSETPSKLDAPRRGYLRDSLHRAARVAWIGGLLGLLLRVSGHLAIAMNSAPGRWAPTQPQRVVGAAVLVASFSAFFGATAFVLLTAQRGRPGRLAIVGMAAVGAIVVGIDILGVALRVVTGSHLTLSGLAFVMNSGPHVAGEIVRRFPLPILGLVLAVVVVGVGLSRLVRWALAPKQPSPRRTFEVTVFAVTGVVAIGYWFIPVPVSFALGVRQSCPELAFVSSMSTARPASTSAGSGGSVGTKLRTTALDLESPPIDAGQAWMTSAPAKGVRPNVILITVEATNVHHLGYEGYDRGTTPNLDALAKTSLVAHRAYTTATHSNYAQPAILSSLFPRRGSDLDTYTTLDYPRFLLHDAMNALGYATATISSQDETWQGMKRFQDTGTPTYYRHAPDFHGAHIDIGTEEVVPDDVTIDHVLAWIDSERTKGKPLSIYVNLQATHFPYVVPAKASHPFTPFEPKGPFNYVDYRREELPTVINKYDNSLHYIDTQVGRIVDGLASRGMLDNTLLVFVADHGELFYDHDLVTHGRSLYENEARVPLIFHYPKGIEPGSVATPVTTLDIMPTILDAIGVPVHPSMQGASVLRYRTDAPTDASSVEPADPRHPAIFLNIQGWKHLDGIVCYPFKVIYDPESETATLIDLARDPDELGDDLSAKIPDLAGALLATLHEQIDLQLEYHGGEGHRAHTHYAPRLRPCPDVARVQALHTGPAVPAASASGATGRPGG